MEREADPVARSLRSGAGASPSSRTVVPQPCIPVRPHICTQGCAGFHPDPPGLSLQFCSPALIHSHINLGTCTFTLHLTTNTPIQRAGQKTGFLTSVCLSPDRLSPDLHPLTEPTPHRFHGPILPLTHNTHLPLSENKSGPVVLSLGR